MTNNHSGTLPKIIHQVPVEERPALRLFSSFMNLLPFGWGGVEVAHDFC